MIRGRVWIGAIVSAAVLAGVGFWLWHARSDEARITHAVRESCEAVSNKDVRGVLKHCAPDFRLEPIGGPDEVRPWLFVVFRQVGEIEARLDRITVEVAPDRRSARAWAVIRGRAEGVGPSSGEWTQERVRIDFVRDGRRWRIRAAELPDAGRFGGDIRPEDLRDLF